MTDNKKLLEGRALKHLSKQVRTPEKEIMTYGEWYKKLLVEEKYKLIRCTQFQKNDTTLPRIPSYRIVDKDGTWFDITGEVYELLKKMYEPEQLVSGN